MADSIKDLLFQKAEHIELDEVRNDLHIIQDELERLYPKTFSILSFNQGALHVCTPSSSVASDLRLQKFALTQNLNQLLQTKLISMRISIR